jgi:hypothetical protein
VVGEPEAERERHHGGHAGDDADQGQPLAAAGRRDQGRGEGAARDGGHREAEAADQADRGDGGQAGRRDEDQRRRAQQDQAGGHHQAVAEAGHQPRGGQFAGDGGEHQRGGDQSGAGAAGAGRAGVPRHHRQQQVEAGRRAEDGDEAEQQRAGDEGGAGGRGGGHGWNATDGMVYC